MSGQADTPNVSSTDNGLVYYKDKQFAFPAISSLAVSKGFETIHRLPEAQINIFDVTQSLEVLVKTNVFNQKLGINKAYDINQKFVVADTNTYFDASNNYFVDATGSKLDDITLTSSEFSSSIESASQIVSVGKFSTLYTDFASYVASYFGLTVGTATVASTGTANLLNDNTANSAAAGFQVDGSGVATGFATLFSGAYNWNANGGNFGASEMYKIIKGDGAFSATDDSGIGQLNGQIKLSNINALLRYAVDSNCFGNRDAVNGTTALDPNFRNNYGMTDGFMEGDLIFIPNNGFAITLNLNINYNTTLNTYIDNNIGVSNSATTATNLNSDGTVTDSDGLAGTAGQTGINNSNFHATSVTSRNLLSRTVSCPLLIRMADSVAAASSSAASSSSGSGAFA